MPNYPIKRKALTAGTRIEATANPGIGKVYELVRIHPVGYCPTSGRHLHFAEYDFREIESGRERTGFTLNYINRYFKAA